MLFSKSPFREIAGIKQVIIVFSFHGLKYRKDA
jgi:hypothetical protein